MGGRGRRGWRWGCFLRVARKVGGGGVGGEGVAAVGLVLVAAWEQEALARRVDRTVGLIQVPGGFGIIQGIVPAVLLDEGLDAELAVATEGEALRGEEAPEVLDDREAVEDLAIGWG